MAKPDGNFSPKVRQTIWERDGYACIICGRYSEQIHHRRPKAKGGTSVAWVGEVPNGIVLCGSGTTGCHGWVHDHPAQSRSRGWIISPNWTQVTAMSESCWYPLLGLRLFLDQDGAMREAPTDDPNF